MPICLYPWNVFLLTFSLVDGLFFSVNQALCHWAISSALYIVFWSHINVNSWWYEPWYFRHASHIGCIQILYFSRRQFSHASQSLSSYYMTFSQIKIYFYGLHCFFLRAGDFIHLFLRSSSPAWTEVQVYHTLISCKMIPINSMFKIIWFSKTNL